MGREIKLDGGEISLLKAIGLGGSQVSGKMLVERESELEQVEFLDTLSGLIEQGYVLSSKVNVRDMEDVERSLFRVNPTHARELRDAINPSRSRDRDRARRDRR